MMVPDRSCRQSSDSLSVLLMDRFSVDLRGRLRLISRVGTGNLADGRYRASVSLKCTTEFCRDLYTKCPKQFVRLGRLNDGVRGVDNSWYKIL